MSVIDADIAAKPKASFAHRAGSRGWSRWVWVPVIGMSFIAGRTIDLAPLYSALAPDAWGATHAPADVAAHRVAVSVGAVSTRSLNVVIHAVGTITSRNSTLVRSRVDGELMALHFKEGQAVHAGQLLAEIDPRPMQIALEQAEGALARDKASLDSAVRDAARFHDLLDKDSIARQQVDQQDALVAQLRGAVRVDQAQRENADLQLSYTRIVAPISGLAGLRQVDVGNQVHASDGNGLLVINQTQPVDVTFAVPETYLPRIRQSLGENRRVPIEVWDAEQKSRLAVGQVAALENAIEVSTGTIKLRASVENADDRLYPNQFVNVRLLLDSMPGTLAVPNTALMRSNQGSYVFVVTGGDTVHVRGLRQGATDGEWTAVQGSLKAGDWVVTDGTDRLRDGSHVEVVQHAVQSGSGANGPGFADADAQVTSPAPAAHEVHEAPRRMASADAAPAKSREGAGPASDPRGHRPSWVDRLPPDEADKVMAMTPEQRDALLRSKLADRAEREAQAMTGPNPPDWMKRLPPESVERLLRLSPQERQSWLLNRMVERAQQ